MEWWWQVGRARARESVDDEARTGGMDWMGGVSLKWVLIAIDE